MKLRHVYLALSVLGLTLPWVAEHGLDLPLYLLLRETQPQPDAWRPG